MIVIQRWRDDGSCVVAEAILCDELFKDMVNGKAPSELVDKLKEKGVLV